MRADVIFLDQLTVKLGGREVLAGATARLPDGAFVGLVGAPLAGKTVLVKAICGLVEPASGCATVDGDDLAALARSDPRRCAQARGRLGVVFQNDALFDSMDAARNVMLPLLRRGVGEPDARARALAALATVDLGAAAAKTPAELSGGMRKRLGLARALAGSPRHLLLDDPTAGLDPVTAARIVRLLGEAHARAGGVTLAAGFEPALLEACTHLLVLREGRVEAFGGAREARRSAEAVALLGEAA